MSVNNKHIHTYIYVCMCKLKPFTRMILSLLHKTKAEPRSSVITTILSE